MPQVRNPPRHINTAPRINKARAFPPHPSQRRLFLLPYLNSDLFYTKLKISESQLYRIRLFIYKRRSLPTQLHNGFFIKKIHKKKTVLTSNFFFFVNVNKVTSEVVKRFMTLNLFLFNYKREKRATAITP